MGQSVMCDKHSLFFKCLFFRVVKLISGTSNRLLNLFHPIELKICGTIRQQNINNGNYKLFLIVLAHYIKGNYM
jgi:hypothetical protein